MQNKALVNTTKFAGMALISIAAKRRMATNQDCALPLFVTTTTYEVIKVAMATMLCMFLLCCTADRSLKNEPSMSKTATDNAASGERRINNNFFGINAWMLAANPCVGGGSLGSHLAAVQNSGAKFVRIGGKTYDRCLLSAADYTLFDIPGMLAVGQTPLVQLSYYDPATNMVWSDPEDAAAYLVPNVVTPLYDQGVRHFLIGNEPNGAANYNTLNVYGNNQSRAAGIYDYISVISNAIRSVYNDGNNNAVFVMGPALTHYDEQLVDSLTSGPYNLLPYIDYFNFHYYPFGDEGNTTNTDQIEPTRDNIINVLRPGVDVFRRNGSIVTPLESRLTDLNNIIRNSAYPAVKVAITETNLCYKNVPNDYLIEGNGTNGFLAGQFWAEMMAVCMSRHVAFVSFWSAIEGSAASNYTTDIGFINSQNGNFKSTYYHFQMMAQNFQGTFKWGSFTGLPGKIKAFASTGSSGIAIMVLNQEAVNSLPVTVRLNNTLVPGGGVDINFAFGINKSYSDVLAAQETLLLLFDRNTGSRTILRYNLNDNALNLAPH